MTSVELLAALSKLQAESAEIAATARQTDSGTGSSWEWRGYAELIGEAMGRITRHRRRSEGVDRQIAHLRHNPRPE